MIERKPEPEPYVANEVRIIGAGTVVWVVVGLIMALSGATSDHLWTIVAGVLIGLNGVRIAYKRRAKSRAAQLSN